MPTAFLTSTTSTLSATCTAFDLISILLLGRCCGSIDEQWASKGHVVLAHNMDCRGLYLLVTFGGMSTVIAWLLPRDSLWLFSFFIDGSRQAWPSIELERLVEQLIGYSIIIIRPDRRICGRSPSRPIVLSAIFGLGHLKFIDLSNIAVNINQIDLISLASFRSSAASDFIIRRLLLISDYLLRCLWVVCSCESFWVMDHSWDRLLSCVACYVVWEKHMDLLSRDQWALWFVLILRACVVIWWLSRVKTLDLIISSIFLGIHWIVSFSQISWRGVRLVSPARNRLYFGGWQALAMQKHWTTAHIIHRDISFGYIWPWHGPLTLLLLLSTLDLLLPAIDLLARLLMILLLLLHVCSVLTYYIIQIVYALV